MNDPVGAGWRLGLVAWVVVAVGLFWWSPRPSEGPAVEPEEEAVWARTAAQAAADARSWQARSGDIVIPWDEASGHLAIVVDDVGRELHVLERLLALRHRLTFSILPDAVYAAGAQLRLTADSRRLREIMVHLPMEPLDSATMEDAPEPSEQFLRIADGPAEIRDKVVRALARVPVAVGVNNHMGSRFTAEPMGLDVVMQILADRNLYFLDSRTTPVTVAEACARRAGVPALARAVFLDHDPSPSAIARALEHAATQARHEPTVAIGHPTPALVRVLEEKLPALDDAGIGIYPVSRLLAHQQEADMSHP